MQIRFDSAIPIYQQIIDEVKRALGRGEMHPGEKLPSQRDLALSLHVNPNTVQRAYREMELLGLIETKRGQGTFLSEDPELVRTIRREMAATAVRLFVRDMRSLGLADGEIEQLLQEGLKNSAGMRGEVE